MGWGRGLCAATLAFGVSACGGTLVSTEGDDAATPARPSEDGGSAVQTPPGPDAGPGWIPTFADTGGTWTPPGADAGAPWTPPPAPDGGAGPDASPGLLAPEIYDESTIVDFHLDFTADQWSQFTAYRAAGQKVWVRCAFTFQGERFEDAACRSKGNPEVWPDEPKPELAVKFNEWTKGARFRGLRGLNLEANPYHPAPVRDRLGMWLFREAGVVAARANHARVFLNGGYLGLYQNLEKYDQVFLPQHFEAPEGNLYDQGYELETNETTGDTSRLEALDALVDAEPLNGDHTAFWSQLAAMVDIPEVVRELAVEAVLPTADNFSNGSDNFYYYDDPLRGFVVLPWDLDTILDEYSPPDADPFEYTGGEVHNSPNKMRQLINANPLWREQFVDALVEIRDGPYAQLGARARAVCLQIRAAAQADPNKPDDMGAFDADCLDIEARAAARIAWLKAELGR